MSKQLSVFCLILYPLLTTGFFVIGFFDRDGLYKWLLREDGPVEWGTAVMIILAGVFALGIAWRLKRLGRRGWLVIAVAMIAAILFLAGMEEVSYGQRLFGWESSEFFMEHSDQQETNLHNVAQTHLKNLGLRINKTRHFAALVMGAYGIAFPVLVWLFMGRVKRDALWRLAVPPLCLLPGFALGCHMTMFDWPTGYEEEIGETYLASCLLIVTRLAWVRLRPGAGLGGPGEEPGRDA